MSDEDSVMYDNVNGYDHDVLINSIKKPSSMRVNDRLNDEEFERAITPRSPPVTSSSSVTVSVSQPPHLNETPLPTTTTKPNPVRKSSESSLPSSPCTTLSTNAIIKNAPKRISSPINIKKKESPQKMITQENDHVETISIDPKDDIKIEINDNSHQLCQ